MGSGRFVGGFDGVRGQILMPNGRFVQPGSLMAGGSDGWQQAILTAGSTDPCAPGQTIFEVTDPRIIQLSSDGIGPPTYGVYVIEGIPALPACNYRFEVDADLSPPFGVAAAVHAYLNDAGIDPSDTFAFAGGSQHAELAAIPAHGPVGSYSHYTFKIYPTASPAYDDFVGPLGPQSVYLWVPVLPPDFTTGTWDTKNVHVKITTI